MQQYQLQLQQFANQQHPYAAQQAPSASHQAPASSQAQGTGSATGQQQQGNQAGASSASGAGTCRECAYGVLCWALNTNHHIIHRS